MELLSNDDITQDIIESGCVTWDDLVRSVRNFKYERNAHREDINLVWYERKGTCSSKHAFLFEIAQKNALPSVKLLVGIYLMTSENTPAVGSVLKEYKLTGIPEAHCYLKVENDYLDVTTVMSSYENFASDVLIEKEITPTFVINEKINYHQSFLENWIQENEIPYTLEVLWEIREQCIAQLSL